MRKLSFITSLMLVLTLCAANLVLAQTQIPKAAPNAKTAAGKAALDFPVEGRKAKNGRGYSANLSALPQAPKRIALVSFYGFDPGITRVTASSYSTAFTTTTTTTTRTRSAGNGGEIAAMFYDKGLEGMRSTFSRHGMELLTPDQFLDTDAKRTAYQAFRVQHSKLSEFATNMGNQSLSVYYGYPEGYTVCDIENEPYANYTKTGLVGKKGKVVDVKVQQFRKDPKMTESLGYDLCKTLGVDAVAVVYFTHTRPNAEKNMLHNFNLAIFGPNPIALPDGKEDATLYSKGLFYAGARYYLGMDGLPFRDYNKKKPETNALSDEGIDHILTGLATAVGAYIQKSTGGK
ncbi:MAG: hypothetical protein SF052_27310 [Bacteroidia bacterium]|nr:hypothetical protein [Bacteroidia bacterium]